MHLKIVSILVIFKIAYFCECCLIESSSFRRIATLNLTDSNGLINQIGASISIPTNTGLANSDPTRYCLAQCNQVFACLMVAYDSTNATCALYDSGPMWYEWSEVLPPQYDYIQVYYKARSALQCLSNQYFDGYSCGRF